MTNKIITITSIITGLLLTSVLTVNTTIIPASYNIISNSEVKVVLTDTSTSKEYTHSLDIDNLTLIPVHRNSYGNFQYSSTMSMNDLTTTKLYDNAYYQKTYNLKLTGISTSDTSKYKLAVKLDIEGECDIIGALRVIVKRSYNGAYAELTKDNLEQTIDGYLPTYESPIIITIYYELEDEDCTLTNLQNAEEYNITLRLYAYAE